MTEHHPEVEPTLYSGSYTLPEGYGRAAADVFMRLQLRRATPWIQIGLILLFIPAIIALLFHGQFAVLLGIVCELIVITSVLIGWFAQRGSLRRRLQMNTAPGSLYELTLTESMIGTRTPVASSLVRYHAYESVHTLGDFVFLRIRNARTRSILPRQLFTPESLAFVQSKVHA